MIDFDKKQFIKNFVTKRSKSLFADDWVRNRDELLNRIEGKAVLVIGGAGSIGSKFVKSILEFQPATMVVVDHNENGLTELTRDLRSNATVNLPAHYRTYPINFGHRIFRKILKEYSFNIVANFAAHKHVRSEKDAIAIEAMIENNVFYVDNLLIDLAKESIEHTFCVSTDKAANPANVMGATKQLMEEIIKSHTSSMKITTARFANVAFSNGSLLDGFLYRIAKNQPISAPKDIRRFFVSPEESGQLCVLTCVLGRSGEIFFPKIAESEMMKFSDIAEHFLKALGKKAVYCKSEKDAKLMALNMRITDKEYPVYFFDSNTSGEKPYEEFYTKKDSVDLNRFNSIGVIQTDSLSRTEVELFLSKLKTSLLIDQLSKDDIVYLLKQRLKDFDHIETGKTLDDRM